MTEQEHPCEGTAEKNTSEASYTPADVIEWIRTWLTQPNRERSKFTDIAMVVLTVLIAIAAFWSACIFQGQLNAARHANDLNREQWGAEHRPWLGMDTLALSSIRFTSQRPSVISVHLEGTMALKNFGTYPAFSANAEITPVFPLPTDAWTKDPLGRPPKGMFVCSDAMKLTQGGEVVFPSRGFTSPFVNDLSWGWKGRTVEVARMWLLVCISYYDGREKEPHHTKVWLRSAHPINAQWVVLNSASRYVPITGFESWGEEAD